MITKFKLFESDDEEYDGNWRKPFKKTQPLQKDIIFNNTPKSLKKYKYKIGDCVIVKDDSNRRETVYQITAIDTCKDFHQPYRVCDVEDDYCGDWCEEDELIFFCNDEDLEVYLRAKKYNL